MEIAFPLPVKKAIRRLREAGYEAWAVGGCVRDSLLGLSPSDWDITSAAPPQKVKELFADCPIYPTGEQHGTLTVVVDGMPLEITVFRTESGYSDGRHPDRVEFAPSIREDLSRRDFTVNALAAAPGEGIRDEFGGLGDLENRIIRCVGEPERRFSEDALRIMRALRFSAVLGFSIHPETAAAVVRCREQLRLVSAERITAELLRLICGKNAAGVLLSFPEVLAVWIPELLPCVGHGQFTRFHLYDVYEHTVRALAAIRPDPVLRMTMLLHDIGKPARFFRDQSGAGHFKGHPAESARLAAEVLRRLRFSKADSARILTLIRYHDAKIHPEQAQFWLSRLGEECFFELMEVKRADNAGQNLAASDRTAEYDAVEEEARRVLSEKRCLSLSGLAVKGEDLLSRGIHGREVGRTLEELLYRVVTGQAENSREALLALLPFLSLPPMPDFPDNPEQMVFRKAVAADLDRVEALYVAVTESAARKTDNLCRGWVTGEYPVRQTAADAIAEGTLYLLESKEGVAGAAVLNQMQPEAYRGGDWREEGRVMVLHTFCVHPAARGKRTAAHLLSLCEKEAAQLGGEVLRLDVLSYNQPAICLYEQAGFRYAGTVDLGLDIPGVKWFRLYEKRLCL